MALCQGRDHLGRLDEEDAVGDPPVADREPQPLEVRLPDGLVLTGVEEHRGRDQRHRLLLGRALVRLDADQAVAQEGLEVHQGEALLRRGLRRQRPRCPSTGRWTDPAGAAAAPWASSQSRSIQVETQSSRL